MSNKTKVKYELVMKLNGMDSKLKFNPKWNQAVKSVFSATGSFCFENLVFADYESAYSLYTRFK